MDHFMISQQISNEPTRVWEVFDEVEDLDTYMEGVLPSAIIQPASSGIPIAISSRNCTIRELEPFKDLIKSLYIDQKKTLEQIRRHMRDVHGYDAS